MAETTHTPADQSRPIHLSRAEFLWLTTGVWIGGIFILALLPLVLIPRLGIPLGVAASYFVFFLAWQPVQSITQRTLGMRAAVLRMIIFVAGAATVAYYLRGLLPLQ
ncbi:MAG: hypothetical protein LC791_01000 [Acidobacteria bacterium]|nr:hypothetical protein [Acidobacteriota bacterium]